MLHSWFGLLSAGGALYIEVPNLASRTARLLGPRWPLWYVPKHLTHFTAETLQRAVVEAGGSCRIGRCEMPMMGNVVALKSGHSRFDARFRLVGMALHPVQLVLEASAGQGTCLFAIATRA